MDATDPRKESVSCPMDFILRMLMGPWTTYILYNLKPMARSASAS